MQLKTLKTLFETHKESTLFGRYIHYESIAYLLEKLNSKFAVETIGVSVNELPIHAITFGQGDKKILMWSQMHGNESTTTKAVFDLLNVFSDDNSTINQIFETCTIKIIPILNPDGAKAYTRVNANGVDLNRDAQDLSQPESKALRTVFEEFRPSYCYNLHGQRTIFSAGNSDKTATVSFLAPAQDANRSVTTTRKIAMEIIAVMNDNLQQQIENQVGIYDDGFNINCVGDTFQTHDVPTLLFEAGHYEKDYSREKTREFIFQSLLVSLNYIANNDIDGSKYESYFDIPKNDKLFYDIIIRNANGVDVAIQYQEKLIDGILNFVPKIEKISDLKNFFAHKEIDANGHEVFRENNMPIQEGNEIDFVMLNNDKFLLNL
nr:M14 family zinc carboxypeptidase [uncultured Psychroserpens sp.]